MNVLVDTSVWSLALRPPGAAATPEVKELAELIGEGRVLMMGAIRQELLSGVRTAEQFKELRDGLRAFPDIELEAEDYEEAANCFSKCRTNDIAGSHADFLICAVAMRRKASLLTTDSDFDAFARVLRFKRHRPR
jgi:predicted nucleic acid-binding protein